MAHDKQPGRGWAYTGAICGGAVSIAANVAHSFLPPLGAPADWSPEIGAVVGAIVWPVFLFVAVEILARTAWPRGWSWGLLRFAGLLPVAGVAAFVSYRHLSGLLAHYGEEPIVHIIGPLAVDGLMIMATGALLATRRVIRAPSAAHSAQPTTTPVHAVAPVPPAAPPTVAPATAAGPAPAPRPAAIPTPAEVKARVPQRQPTVAPEASPAMSSTDSPVTARDTALTGPKVSPAQLARARALAKAHQRDSGTAIRPGELAVRMHISSERASDLLTALNATPLTSATR